MRELLDDVTNWRARGLRVALATVVETWGSAPRRPGAKLAVSSEGHIAGSVSGGCVEASVVEEGLGALAQGVPRLVRYGVTSERAWEVGLTCGGTIEILIETWTPALDALAHAAAEERLATAVTSLEPGTLGRRIVVSPEGAASGTLGSATLDEAARAAAREQVGRLASGRVELDADGATLAVFVDVLAPRPRLVVVGGVHVAIPLVRMARAAGFRTVVVDPRASFATAERFPEADERIVDWPAAAFERLRLDATTCVAVLSHDAKIDVPALSAALRSPARYVGALGSRKTWAGRAEALAGAGHAPEEIARVHAPIGLDLGGSAPEEIAVAILAEIVAALHGG